MLNIDQFLINYFFCCRSSKLIQLIPSLPVLLHFFLFHTIREKQKRESTHTYNTKEKKKRPTCIIEPFACLIIPFIRSRSLQIER